MGLAWPGWGGAFLPGVLPGWTQGPPLLPVAPGCVPFGNIVLAYEFLVSGLANPFALRWVPVGTIFGGVPAGEIMALGRTVPVPNAANLLHPGDGGRTTGDVQHWHHISISVQGEAIFPSAAVPDRPENTAGNGHHSSIVKARITLALDNSRTRTFVADVGAGIEIDVKCRAVEMIEALVPDPTSLPDGLPPPLAEPFTFFAIITTCVTTCEAPQGYRMPTKYSQSFFLNPGALTWTMPVVEAAQEVELLSSDPFDPPVGPTVGTFLYVRTADLDPSVGTPPNAVPIGDFGAPAGRGPRTIPGNANAISVERPLGAAAGPVTVIQLLNV